VPYRGKTNQPAFVPWVAKQIGDLRGLSQEEVGRITSDNFERLFARIAAPAT
jgi:TatD DNase family protein